MTGTRQLDGHKKSPANKAGPNQGASRGAGPFAVTNRLAPLGEILGPTPHIAPFGGGGGYSWIPYF